MSNDYVLLNPTHLKQQDYPFDIFVMSAGSEEISLRFKAQTPLDQAALNKLHEEFNQKRGPFILEREVTIVALSLGIKKEELQKAPPPKEDIQLRQERFFQELQQEQVQLRALSGGGTDAQGEAKPLLQYNDQLRFCFANNDFSQLIDYVRKKVMSFPLDLSSTVSQAYLLAETFMQEENLLSQTLALSHILGELYGLETPQYQAQLFCAAAFKDIGKTQLPLNIINRPLSTLSKDDLKTYQSHPLYSEYYLKIARIRLDSPTKLFILTHHECADGSGYPKHLMHEEIPMPAHILSLVENLLDYAYGRVSGKQTPYFKILKWFVSHTKVEGLRTHYPEEILALIRPLLP